MLFKTSEKLPRPTKTKQIFFNKEVWSIVIFSSDIKAVGGLLRVDSPPSLDNVAIWFPPTGF